MNAERLTPKSREALEDLKDEMALIGLPNAFSFGYSPFIAERAAALRASIDAELEEDRATDIRKTAA
ncbi:MAG: hypothetical protein AAGF59_03650 [Pseudomonadota bacterium]